MGAPQYEQAGADIGGTGTTNTIPRWTGPSTLGDSLLSQGATGDTIFLGTPNSVYPLANRGAISINGTSTALVGFTIGGLGQGYLTASGSSLQLIAAAAKKIEIGAGGAVGMTFDTSNNVGFGTASPITRAHAVGTGTLLAGTAYQVLQASQDQTTYRGAILGYDSSGQIGIVAAATSAAGSNLAFWTYSGSAWGERARIDSSGNVGIGTASPAYRADVQDTQNGTAGLRVRNLSSGASAYATVFIGTDTNAADAGILRSGSANAGYNGANGLTIWTSAAHDIGLVTNNVLRMRVSSAGTQAQSQVAIGTSSFTSGRALTTVADLDVFGLTVGRGANGVSGNTAVGAAALGSVTSASATVGVGFEALNALSTGAGNTAVGYRAVRAVTTSNSNTGIGYLAVANMTGASNTGLGQQALQGAVGASGGSNVGIGLQAGLALTTGANNVLVGSTAGDSVTTGSSNIVIGSGADLAAATDSNKLVIGDATNYVATNGGATTYYATAGALAGYIIVRLNGTDVKLPVYAL